MKGGYECGNFEVKEYAPAAFKVDTVTEKDEYVSKDKIAINVDAAYYFGVPVANASVAIPEIGRAPQIPQLPPNPPK